jgi:hypothetical protein
VHDDDDDLLLSSGGLVELEKGVGGGREASGRAAPMGGDRGVQARVAEHIARAGHHGRVGASFSAQAALAVLPPSGLLDRLRPSGGRSATINKHR